MCGRFFQCLNSAECLYRHGPFCKVCRATTQSQAFTKFNVFNFSLWLREPSKFTLPETHRKFFLGFLPGNTLIQVSLLSLFSFLRVLIFTSMQRITIFLVNTHAYFFPTPKFHIYFIGLARLCLFETAVVFVVCVFF